MITLRIWQLEACICLQFAPYTMTSWYCNTVCNKICNNMPSRDISYTAKYQIMYTFCAEHLQWYMYVYCKYTYIVCISKAHSIVPSEDTFLLEPSQDRMASGHISYELLQCHSCSLQWLRLSPFFQGCQTYVDYLQVNVQLLQVYSLAELDSPYWSKLACS